MKSFDSEIKKYAEKTRLKAVEREMIRDRILSYMEYHPLKKDRIDEGVLSSLQHRDFVYVSLNSLWVKVGSGALAFMLIVGVPFLAERSVPGDALYLVKTEVTENIRTQLASTPYEKVELETKLMERRIAEARLLASEGKLTTEVEAKIAETVKGHAHAVQNGLAELRVDDADGAALAEIVFSSALEVQSAVLDQSDVASSSSVGSILEVVNTVRDEVASDENPTTPSYEGLLARIELETTRSYELFTSVKESATAEETADMERRLADIDRSIVGAKELKEIDEAGSIAEMIEVLGLIQKLIAFMTDIDIRETVALETLVPVIHTPEERAVSLGTIMTDLRAGMLLIEKKVALITDEALLEKVAPSVALVYTLEGEIDAALLEGNLDLGEVKSIEAQAVVDDLMRITADIIVIEEPLGVPEMVLPGEEVGTSTEAIASTTDPTPEPAAEDIVVE
jgi:Domain of unknown function (DUF5667)